MEVPAFTFRGPDANFASAKSCAVILGPGGSREPYEELARKRQRLASSSVPPADVLGSTYKIIPATWSAPDSSDHQISHPT
jgi:hypothetical protein